MFISQILHANINQTLYRIMDYREGLFTIDTKIPVIARPSGRLPEKTVCLKRLSSFGTGLFRSISRISY